MTANTCPREPNRFPLLAKRRTKARAIASPVDTFDEFCVCGFLERAHGFDVGEVSGLVCPVTRPWSASTLTLAEAREIQVRLGGAK